MFSIEAKYTGEITSENYVVNQKFHHHNNVAPRWQSASKDIAQLEYFIVYCLLFVCYRENMPSHYKFKEYCPLVFRNIRERFNVSDDEFMVSQI